MFRKELLDLDTGEVVDIEDAKKKKKKVTDFNKEVGVDTKYPYHCVTVDSLNTTLDVMDAYYKDKARVDYEYLLVSVLDGYMHKSELALLRLVSKNLAGWNIFIGTSQFLTECGIDIGNVGKVVKASKNLRVLSRDKPFKGCIVLEINPLVAWKGDTEYRKNRVETWYSAKK